MSKKPTFTDEEKTLLAPYVTSTDDNVFAVTGLTGITGAVYARYSRAKGGFREVLLKEFIREGVVDSKKAGDLIERVLIAFGDDSVGELEGAHVSFENISILATKEIEDRRIGGSPIEQSTRYVFYDQKDDEGNFRYYLDPKIMASQHAQAYVDTMNFIFETYCELVEPMKDFYKNLKSIDEAEYDVVGDKVKRKYAELEDEGHKKAFRITYNSDIRTKACDTLRYLLPVATLTNVGVFGNGRFFQNVLSHCYTSPFGEVQDIAKNGQTALDKIMPRYVKRAQKNEYIAGVRTEMEELALRLFADKAPERDASDVHLLERANNGDEENIMMIAQMLYPHLTHPLAQIREEVRKMDMDTRLVIFNTYIGKREARRNRPGRALESGYPYTFDLVTDFGTYKDLMRHRMMTQVRQRFTPAIGFRMPEDLVKAGYDDKALACVEKAQALYETLVADFPELASYSTLHGSEVRWSMGINDRALMHLTELRTTPQGHSSYRKVGQELHKAVAKRHPWRAQAMKFVDYGDYYWSRADSEARQRVKEAALENKEQE